MNGYYQYYPEEGPKEDSTKKESIYRPWTHYATPEKPEPPMHYMVELPAFVTDVISKPFAKGFFKTCHNASFRGKECVLLVAPMDVALINEDVNHTKGTNMFYDASPTTLQSVHAEKTRHKFVQKIPELAPELWWMGICKGTTDQDSIDANYPTEAMAKSGYKIDDPEHGKQRLNATRFFVQIWEPYEMSLEQFMQDANWPKGEIDNDVILDIVHKIMKLESKLTRYMLRFNDEHSGNVVLRKNKDSGLYDVRFIDIGFCSDARHFRRTYLQHFGYDTNRYVDVWRHLVETKMGLQGWEPWLSTDDAMSSSVQLRQLQMALDDMESRRLSFSNSPQGSTPRS